jgi:hypothetical protein
MLYDDLTEQNFGLYAAKAYAKPNAVLSEFEEDVQRFIYLKRLLTKYYSSGVLKDRLILNHIIVIYNVFGIEAATRMLFFKLDERDLEVVKPFLIFLHFLPEKVYGINGKAFINTADIRLDEGSLKCIKNLRQ